MVDYFSTTALSQIITANLGDFPTSVEFLRLRRSPTGDNSVLEVDGRFQDDVLNSVDFGNLVNASEPDAATPSPQPFFQILFLSSIRDQHGCTTERIKMAQNTLELLCVRIGVSSTFLEAVLVPSVWSKQSGASYYSYDSNEEVKSLNGFYHYFGDWDLGPLHAWFTYNFLTRSTTYILVDCPEAVRSKIKSLARSQDASFLFRPLSVDFLLAEECAAWRETFIHNRYKELFHWNELSSNKMDPPIRFKVLNPNNLQNLHTLSRTWNMLYEDLGDMDERLSFLIATCSKLSGSSTQKSEAASAAEAFEFLRARNQLRRRWVTSFGERTKLISQFVFSFAAQNVNQASLSNTKTNIQIQRDTARIADETAKDNSSMITIATMTMLFLPGTFISAIFSMVFFTYDGTGSRFDVSPWVWLYFAVTVPLTAFVFGVYLYWRRRRQAKKRRGSDVSLEMGVGTSIPSANGAAG